MAALESAYKQAEPQGQSDAGNTCRTVRAPLRYNQRDLRDWGRRRRHERFPYVNFIAKNFGAISGMQIRIRWLRQSSSGPTDGPSQGERTRGN